MRVVRGTFDGTGAIINVGIGFIPKWVKLWNIEDGSTTALTQGVVWEEGLWTKTARGEGLAITLAADLADGASAETAVTAGVSQYLGGDTGDGTETYLMADPNPDKRGTHTAGTISKWTLDASSTRAGHFDKAFGTTAPNIVGDGSRVYIDSGNGAKMYYIVSYSNDGDAASDIILNRVAPTGNVTFVGGKFTYVAVPVGTFVPAGFTLAALSNYNADGETITFEAGDE